MTSNNAKSDKEKLDEIIGVIEQKDYLLTKDYFELEAELEEYFQTCESIISNKNSSYLNEANYAAGLIQELLEKTDTAIEHFKKVNYGDKSSKSVSLYEKSRSRLFLICSYSYLYSANGNNTQELFIIINKLFKEIETIFKLKNETDDRFSEILFMMALVSDKKDIEDNKDIITSNSYEEYLLRIISSKCKRFNKIAYYYLTIKTIDKILEISTLNNTDDKNIIYKYYFTAEKYMEHLEEYVRNMLNNVLLFARVNSLVAKYLIGIYGYVDFIKDKLRIVEPRYLRVHLFHETKVAHYTSPLVAHRLLDKEGSNIRLNTINYVNDPTEGIILEKYLGTDIKSTIKNRDIGIFISCFTFNHDSLNQFRLYGKNNGIEASGVSMVFNINFFNNYLYYSDNSILPNANSNKYLREKTRLYRCIYIDPDSNYIYLSRRNKVTFYKEYSNKLNKYGVSIDDIDGYLETKQHIINKQYVIDKAKDYLDKLKKSRISIHDLSNDVDNTLCKIVSNIVDKKIDELWGEYNDLINKYELEIKDDLFKIVVLVNEIKSNFNKLNDEQINDVSNIISSALLPLQYLVKHAAFKEEEECRMIQIVKKLDNRIKKDICNKIIYIDYPLNVKAYLYKIYFSPGAKDYKDFFVYEDLPESKLKDSLNPFRNK